MKANLYKLKYCIYGLTLTPLCNTNPNNPSFNWWWGTQNARDKLYSPLHFLVFKYCDTVTNLYGKILNFVLDQLSADREQNLESFHTKSLRYRNIQIRASVKVNIAIPRVNRFHFPVKISGHVPNYPLTWLIPRHNFHIFPRLKCDITRKIIRICLHFVSMETCMTIPCSSQAKDNAADRQDPYFAYFNYITITDTAGKCLRMRWFLLGY